MRKKTLLPKGLGILLAAAICMGGATGCGSGPAEQGNAATGDKKAVDSGEAVTIQWWTPNWDEPESREMAEEFEKDNPNIKVELVVTDWDTYKDKITTAISAKGAPELFTILLTDVKPFADKGLLEPLTELGTKAGVDFDDILAPALDITSVDGQAYGVPFRYDGSGIYYNETMLKEAGYNEFPKTWDEMLEMSGKLSDEGKIAFAWPLGNQANAVTRFVQQLYTYGGEVLNDDETKCLLDSDEAVTALENIVDTIKEGYASQSSSEIDNTKMREMFGTEQLAFNLTGPFDVDSLKTDYPDLKWKTAVIPGDGGMACTTANGWCVAMAQNSEHKEEAAKFMAYITKPENQARLTDSFPASKTAMEYEKFATEELKPFIEQLNNSKPEPAYTCWSEVEPVIYSYLQSAVSGDITPKEACSKMAKDINAMIGM